MEGKGALCINLFGGPGIGKSTTAAGVFNLLKLHSIETELITEFAKELVWEERFRTFQDQQYLFGKQHHRMWRVKDKVDFMITDSPLLLSNVYRPDTLGESFTTNVVDTINSFYNTNILLTRVKSYNPKGRNETAKEALEVDEKVKQVLKENNMEWIEVPGDHEGINKIVKIILDSLDIKMIYSIHKETI